MKGMDCPSLKWVNRDMALEQYIVRELKEDIKYLIRKIIELDKKIEKLDKCCQVEAHHDEIHRPVEFDENGLVTKIG